MANITDVSQKQYAEVIINSGIGISLDYEIPNGMTVNIGSYVFVPLRGAKKAGIVVQIKPNSSCKKTCAILDIINDDLYLSPPMIELCIWMSKYYVCPIGKIIKLFIPSSINKKTEQRSSKFITSIHSKRFLQEKCKELEMEGKEHAKIIKFILTSNKDSYSISELIEGAGVSRAQIQTLIKSNILSVMNELSVADVEFLPSPEKKLNDEQILAINKIKESINQNIFEAHLIFGITGSGKTEVYLHATEHALSQNKSVLILVPEIALTVQMFKIFKSKFGGKVAIFHHKISEGQKRKVWRQASSGDIKIVIGAKSATFIPLKNCSLIIVDEEHDTAYKQSEDAPCYNARDVSVMRAKICNSTIILGSATPSLESYSNATLGKYNLSILGSKASAKSSLNVKIIDMHDALPKSKSNALFSSEVLSAIRKKTTLGEQSIIFLNRRGFHTSLSCTSCQHQFKCSHCDMLLTYHQYDKSLSCHLCNYQLKNIPSECPQCKNTVSLQYKGIGTEKVQEVLSLIFPDIRSIRIDADTTRTKNSHEILLKQFAAGKADVLIGTQMISKGLNFPNVTLAVILNGDTGLHIPDFRASERVFQTIMQVSGRSGRSQLQGEAIIQAFSHDHPSIKHAASQDFNQFYQSEIEFRKMFEYPPFSRIIKIIISGADQELTKENGNEFRNIILDHTKNIPHTIILPIIKSGYFKLKDLYRFQFLIKSKHVCAISNVISKIISTHKATSKVKILVDVEPVLTFF